MWNEDMPGQLAVACATAIHCALQVREGEVVAVANAEQLLETGRKQTGFGSYRRQSRN